MLNEEEVTPYMGVCIETDYCNFHKARAMSHPIWVCVLKHQS